MGFWKRGRGRPSNEKRAEELARERLASTNPSNPNQTTLKEEMERARAEIAAQNKTRHRELQQARAAQSPNGPAAENPKTQQRTDKRDTDRPERDRVADYQSSGLDELLGATLVLFGDWRADKMQMEHWRVSRDQARVFGEAWDRLYQVSFPDPDDPVAKAVVGAVLATSGVLVPKILDERDQLKKRAAQSYQAQQTARRAQQPADSTGYTPPAAKSELLENMKIVPNVPGARGGGNV